MKKPPKQTQKPEWLTEEEQQLLNAFNARGSRIIKKLAVLTEAVDDLTEKVDHSYKSSAKLVNLLIADKKKLMEENTALIKERKLLEEEITTMKKESLVVDVSEDGQESEKAP